MEEKINPLVLILIENVEKTDVNIQATPVINTKSHCNSKSFTDTENKFFFFIFDADEIPSFWNKNVLHKIDVACFALSPATCHSFFQLDADSDIFVTPNIASKYAIIGPHDSLRALGIDLGATIVDFNIIEGDVCGRND